MPNPSAPPPGISSATIRRWLLSASATLGFALLLRYGFFQSRVVGAICLADRLWWCDIRDALGMIHGFWIWGWAGLASAAAGFWLGWRWALGAGLVLSIVGLVVYNTELGAAGLIVSLLGAVTPPEGRAMPRSRAAPSED